jgi:hypothetical protein
MTYDPKSIEEQIRCLARLTGAPGSFVDQVRALFVSKGIPLDTDATPFVEALEDAFRREETIRASSARARRQMAKLRDDFRKVGRAYVDQLSQLRRLQSSLKEQSRRLRGKPPRQRKQRATRVAVQGDHRSLVTRTEREQLPMVPGPEEPQ